MRLFVAAWPPADVVTALRRLPTPETRGVRWTTPGHWHVTLRFLGSVDDVDSATAAFAGVELPAEPPLATVGPATAVLGRHVLVVPVHGLRQLADAVRRATAAVGDPPDTRTFHGHVTLARGREGMRNVLKPLAGTEISAEWRVREISLVASETHPLGAKYRVLERLQVPGEVP